MVWNNNWYRFLIKLSINFSQNSFIRHPFPLEFQTRFNVLSFSKSRFDPCLSFKQKQIISPFIRILRYLNKFENSRLRFNSLKEKLRENSWCISATAIECFDWIFGIIYELPVSFLREILSIRGNDFHVCIYIYIYLCRVWCNHPCVPFHFPFRERRTSWYNRAFWINMHFSHRGIPMTRIVVRDRDDFVEQWV